MMSSSITINAILLSDYHQIFPNGSRVDITIWKLPKPTTERPHGFEYRLNYSLSNGITLVHYDNRAGKSDHKHIRNNQFPYTFSTIRQLFKDFASDIIKNGGTLTV